MESLIQFILIGQTIIIFALAYMLNRAYKNVAEIASDALTASTATSALDYSNARAVNKITDTPKDQLVPPPPQAPRVFTTPDGTVLEPMRPR